MPHQRAVLVSAARHKVLVCGRRWGKTALALEAILDGHGPTRGFFRGAFQGAHVVWVTPAFPQVTQVWGELKRRLSAVATKINELDKRIELPGGGVILVRSGDNADGPGIRGLRFDGAVIEEASVQKKAIWTEVLAPALSDSQGWAIFIGTPKGRDNWFYDLFEQAAELEGWERWNRPSSDNPLMTPRELEARLREIGSFAFGREYLCQFVVEGGGLFREEWFRYYENLGDRILLDGESFRLEELATFCTVDLAATTKTYSDWSVIATWATTPDRRLVLVDVVRKKIDGAAILRELAEVVDRWKPGAVWIEKTAYHTLLISEARAQMIPVRELIPDRDKTARAEPAAALLEGGRVWFPRYARWLDAWRAELLSFTPSGEGHDDQVDTFGYAVAVAMRTRLEEPGTIEGRVSERLSTRPSLGVRPLPSLRPGR